VDRTIQAAVAAAIKAVPPHAPRRSRDRSSSCGGREVVLRREPANIADLAQDPRRTQGADPGDRRQVGSARLDDDGNLALQLGDFEVEPG